MSQHRNVVLDGLRGLAILLVVLDHSLYVVDKNNVIRATVTRLALPAFMVISGYLITDRLRIRRMVEVGITSLAINGMMAYMSFPLPDILFVYLVVLVVARPYIVDYPLHMALLGIFAAFVFPHVWSGYHPGLVLAYLSIGQAMLSEDLFYEGPSFWKAPLWIARIGRYPLSIYLAHTTILFGIEVIR